MGVPADAMLAPGVWACDLSVSASYPHFVTPPEHWTDDEADNLARIAAVVAQVGGLVGERPRITSGLRRAALNQAVGGSRHSWHLTGRAVDLAWSRHAAIDVLLAMWDAGTVVDDVIAYHPHRGGHMHIQIDGGVPRRRYRVRDADGSYRLMASRDDITRTRERWRP